MNRKLYAIRYGTGGQFSSRDHVPRTRTANLGYLTSQSIEPFQIVATVIITAIALNTALPKLCKTLGWSRKIAVDGSQKINYDVHLFAKE
ncbi:hypothetical protein [Peribacillus simplex]|uniref:hypothetical protein n=1 Tax=Peribacillus simplex TaxID=1478 RepID=UPI002E1DA61B|nr:hypothetical protein [Peribacillus simplex]